MTYNLIAGSSWEFQSGGPPEDPLWIEVLAYLSLAFAFFVLLYGGVAVSRWFL